MDSPCFADEKSRSSPRENVGPEPALSGVEGGHALAEVAVDAPASVGHTFTYAIPPGITLQPGHLVWVPFGPRTLPGIVFSLSQETDAPYTKDILDTLDPEPVLTPHQLALAQWISERYLAPLYACAALMLPPGFTGRLRTLLTLTPLGHANDQSGLSPGQRRLLEHLRSRGWVRLDTLQRTLGGRLDQTVAPLIEQGLVARQQRWPRPRATTLFRSFLELASNLTPATELLVRLQKARAPRQAKLLEHLLASTTPVDLAWARRQFGASAVRGLLARGWTVERRVVQERDPLAGTAFPQDTPPPLLPEQAAALERIIHTLDHPEVAPRSFLLHGVTGSGKTEVYLRALAHTVAQGKRGIVLVPEISLTPQMVQRFAARFPGRVVVLHSRLTPGQHHDQWWRIRQGRADVVIGPRSALFAPQPDLGLVVVDEEHEWTYKQQDVTPRYHAREVALELGQRTGAVVVLGSATPDVATYFSAQTNQHTLLELPRRVPPGDHPTEGQGTPGSLPAVQVVDMRQELKEGNRSIFSRSLTAALERTVAEGQQVLLFLNRRGAATHVQCRDCGATQRCRRCAVALTYHASEQRLMCHQCGRRTPVPAACPVCWGRHIRFLGVGTQRVVEELQRRLPQVTALRWDRDATSPAGAHQRLMDRFQQGEAQVLVGTQMIAKGLHFPGVTLVGVLLADLGLNLPDFRAGERVFQLLCQVVGRGGRGSVQGYAIVQTYDPQHYAVASAAAHDYQAFYRREIQFRKQYRQPPFWRLVRLVFQHPNRALCQREAEQVGHALSAPGGPTRAAGAEIVGPAPAYPERVRGRYRWQLLLRTQGDPTTLIIPLRLREGWTVDIDPVSLT